MIKNAPQAENFASEILYPKDRNKNIFPAYTEETRLCFGRCLCRMTDKIKKVPGAGRKNGADSVIVCAVLFVRFVTEFAGSVTV